MPAAIAETVDLSALADALRGPLLRVSRRLRQEAQKVGLSAQDALILGYIKKNPGVGVSELADVDQISRPTMSSHVKRLEATGWVSRTDNAEDGRRSGLTVTPAGLRKLDAIRRHRNDWLAKRLANLSPEERDRLAAAIEPLANLVSLDLSNRAEALIEDPILDAEAIESMPTPQSVKEEKVRNWIVPAIIGSALLMQTLEATVISNAIPTIARALHEDPLRLNMAITMFLLASAVCLPVSGWIADKFGAKRVFMTSMVLFALSSAACGFAHTLPQLIVGRIFQGVAASMMAPVGRLVLLRTTPKSELVGAMSVLTMPALLGPVIGPVLGGFIVTFFNWRWIFYMNLPVAVVGVLLVRAFVPDVKEQSVSPIDWIGIALTGFGMAALIFGFENLGRGFLPPLAVAGLFVGSALSFGLYWAHARNNPHAIIDLTIFRIKTFSASVVGGAFMRVAMGGTPFLLAMLLQIGFGLSAFAAGLMTFISAAGALVMKSTAPRILRRYGFRTTLIVNAVIVGFSFMAYSLFKLSTPHWVIMIILGVGGFFRSLQFTSLNGLAYADIEQDRMSRASTISSMGQQLIQSIGIGIAATLLHFLMQAKHVTHLTADTVAPAFLVTGAITFISIFWFVGLPKNAGDDMNGRHGARA